MKKVCYSVVLQSQLGPRAGELLLQEDAQVVSGSLSLLGHCNRFSGSVLQSGKYLISGALRSPVDKESPMTPSLPCRTAACPAVSLPATAAGT